jgi:hypothetical protein
VILKTEKKENSSEAKDTSDLLDSSGYGSDEAGEKIIKDPVDEPSHPLLHNF